MGLFGSSDRLPRETMLQHISSATDHTVTAYDVASKTQVKVIHLKDGLAPKRIQVVSVPRATQD